MPPLRRYRFLMYVLLLASLASIRELSETDPQAAKNPVGLPYVMLDLYPESTQIRYVEGVQSVLNGDLRRARAQFERALSTGSKTNEDLLYYYAVTLSRLNADPAEVEAAVKFWRFNFPYSTRPDPRHRDDAAPE